MALPRPFVLSTDPAMTIIIGSIASEYAMYLVDQIGSTLAIELVAGPHEQLNKVADRKCIGPKVPPLLLCDSGCKPLRLAKPDIN
jgi:hypothetical protein